MNSKRSFVEEILNLKGWLKTDTQKEVTNMIKLLPNARATDEEKEVFLLQQYQRFEQYMHWFLGKLVMLGQS
jgi:hypothetical protein